MTCRITASPMPQVRTSVDGDGMCRQPGWGQNLASSPGRTAGYWGLASMVEEPQKERKGLEVTLPRHTGTRKRDDTFAYIRGPVVA